MGLSVAPEPVLAADYYKGKTIKVIIRSSAGGGNDFYGRLLARHMPRHIPGTPRSISINMKGAGGIVAANYMHNRAKKNGTEIAILSRAIAIVQRTKNKGVLYDLNNLIPLGSPASNTAVFVVGKKSSLNSLKDLKRGGKVFKVGTTGPGGGAYQRSMVLKLDGYPLKIITGYGSNGEKVLSVARGDVEITAGSFETMESAIREEGFKIIGKLGSPHPRIDPSVPDLRDVVTADGANWRAFWWPHWRRADRSTQRLRCRRTGSRFCARLLMRRSRTPNCCPRLKKPGKAFHQQVGSKCGRPTGISWALPMRS
jgi:tripartite-type tricarboxylate transporter receptor subunit TctC